jgi:pantetheine-phosphate adenylyltransferase
LADQFKETPVKKALYPGTFDPITNGHLDIIERGSKMFDHLTVAVAEAHHKAAMFDLEERKQLIQASVTDLDNVSVGSFSGLLADEVKKLSVDVVIRGLRAVSDFEYELMLALMNRKLNPDFETVFLMPSEQYIYLHSSIVRELAELGGDVSEMVPNPVLEAFKDKL